MLQAGACSRRPTMTEAVPELPQAPISLDVLHDEVEVAREIQFSILPPAMPEVPGYELWGLLRPTAHTGELVPLDELGRGGQRVSQVKPGPGQIPG